MPQCCLSEPASTGNPIAVHIQKVRRFCLKVQIDSIAESGEGNVQGEGKVKIMCSTTKYVN